ncbi:hypothetical protein I3843_10G054400 [Carya illinoinensis]|nr:hypothetical protein I3843_10G054400 [Carya illinoinensis]
MNPNPKERPSLSINPVFLWGSRLVLVSSSLNPCLSPTHLCTYYFHLLIGYICCEVGIFVGKQICFLFGFFLLQSS